MKLKPLAKAALKYLVLGCILVFVLLPIFWMVLLSLKSRIQTIVYPPTLDIGGLAVFIKNYGDILLVRQGGYWRLLLNSAVIAVASISLGFLLAVPAAYAYSRFNFRHKDAVALTILSAYFLPAMSIAIPIYLIMSRFHLLDTYTGLVIPYVAMNIPFIFWMMMGFFAETPTDLDEAAMVDGCTRLSAFRRVILPLVKPGLVATAIFCAIFTWNEFMMALFIVSTPASATVTVGATGLLSGERPTDWEAMATAGTILTLPLLAFALVVQKHIVRGLTLGAVKG